MDNLETYNRVPSLERPLPKTVLLSVYTLLIFIIIGGVINLAFLGIEEPILDYLTIAAFIVYILIYSIDLKRSRYCQHCQSKLSTINRPFLLTPKFLAMRGQKQGDYFYTEARWGAAPFKRWAKISQQSLACHHCRLSEEKQVEHYEVATEQEINQLPYNQG